MILRCVEEPGRGIAARALPARNDGAGQRLEPAIDFGVEAESRASLTCLSISL